jgi:hypothetical protein
VFAEEMCRAYLFQQTAIIFDMFAEAMCSCWSGGASQRIYITRSNVCRGNMQWLVRHSIYITNSNICKGSVQWLVVQSILKFLHHQWSCLQCVVVGLAAYHKKFTSPAVMFAMCGGWPGSIL